MAQRDDIFSRTINPQDIDAALIAELVARGRRERSIAVHAAFDTVWSAIWSAIAHASPAPQSGAARC